jgi:hypothetical protein
MAHEKQLPEEEGNRGVPFLRDGFELKVPGLMNS